MNPCHPVPDAGGQCRRPMRKQRVPIHVADAEFQAGEPLAVGHFSLASGSQNCVATVQGEPREAKVKGLRPDLERKRDRFDPGRPGKQPGIIDQDFLQLQLPGQGRTVGMDEDDPAAAPAPRFGLEDDVGNGDATRLLPIGKSGAGRTDCVRPVNPRQPDRATAQADRSRRRNQLAGPVELDPRRQPDFAGISVALGQQDAPQHPGIKDRGRGRKAGGPVGNAVPTFDPRIAQLHPVPDHASRGEEPDSIVDTLCLQRACNQVNARSGQNIVHPDIGYRYPVRTGAGHGFEGHGQGSKRAGQLATRVWALHRRCR